MVQNVLLVSRTTLLKHPLDPDLLAFLRQNRSDRLSRTSEIVVHSMYKPKYLLIPMPLPTELEVVLSLLQMVEQEVHTPKLIRRLHVKQ